MTWTNHLWQLYINWEKKLDYRIIELSLYYDTNIFKYAKSSFWWKQEEMSTSGSIVSLEVWLKNLEVRSLSGFPGNSDGKESVHNAGDPGSIPESGGSPGEGNVNPLQCTWPEEFHGQTQVHSLRKEFPVCFRRSRFPNRASDSVKQSS